MLFYTHIYEKYILTERGQSMVTCLTSSDHFMKMSERHQTKRGGVWPAPLTQLNIYKKNNLHHPMTCCVSRDVRGRESSWR